MFDWYLWIGFPLLVFFARVTDVSLGTLRIIFISRGRKNLAPLLGFIEVLIWVSVIAQIIKGSYNIITYIAFAAGFAAGNYVGMFIEEKIALGMLVVRIIIPNHIQKFTRELKRNGFGFTVVNAYGSQGPVKLIYIIINRKNFRFIAKIIQSTYTNAFFTVEELRSSEHGIFPNQTLRSQRQNNFWKRKSK